MRVSLVMIGAGGGGVQQTVIPYCDAMLRAGNQVQVVLYRKSPMLPEISSLSAEAAVVMFPSQQKKMTALSRIGLKRTVLSFEPDVVIGFANRGYPQARKALGNRVPILTRVGSLKTKAIMRLMDADGFIVTSETMKSRVMEHGGDPSRIRVVPNFLRHTDGAPPRTKFRTPPVIGSLGRVMNDKGFDVFVDALHLLHARGVKFRAVIGGGGEDIQTLRAQISRLELEGLVALPGWISNSQKKEFLSELDIFVCPSRYEPFGIVMLEAVSAGLPVIASATTGAVEIFENDVTGRIVPNEDPAALANAIEQLIIHPEQARKLANAASEQFHRRFHIASAGVLLADQVGDLVRAFKSGS